MLDYNDIGLNEILSPLDSPIKFGSASSFDFDSNTERGAVTTSQIQDLAVTNAKIASLTADKISAGTISSGIIYSGTINATQIAAGTLNSGVINSGTLNASNITGGTISANRITGGTMSANYLSAGTIDANNIRVKNIDADEIEGGTVTANILTAGTINGSNVTVNNLDANNITAGTLTGRTVRSSSGNSRIELTNGDSLQFYNSGGTIATLSGFSLGLITAGKLYVGAGISTNIGRSVGSDQITTASLSMAGDIDMNNNAVTEVEKIVFNDNSNTPGDREFLMDDDGSNQRLRVHFANNATQWQVDLTAVCTPVPRHQYDPSYFDKYDLMTELDDRRFKVRYPFSENIQKEYRAKPIWHYPSMGHEGNEWNLHTEAMWKRPWLPMRTVPDRLETMGQYPYPFVESPLIGEGESKANFYQLIAHTYNHQQDRIDELSDKIKVLEEKLARAGGGKK